MRPQIRRRTRQQRAVGRIGGAVLTLIGLLALLAPLIAPYDPGEFFAPLQAPSPEHRLGTNDIGQDILSRLLYGARTSLFIASVATGASTLLGLTVGLLAGYYERLGFFLMRVVDVMLAIPRFPLIILMAAFLQPGLLTLILFFVIFGWPRAARMVRAQILSERNQDYVTAAMALGAKDTRILIHHLMPSAFPILAVYAVMEFQHVILAESGLSFLGLGDPTVRSWGLMLANAFRFPSTFLTDIWLWWAVPPGLSVTLVSMALTMLSFGLETDERS